MFQDRRDAGRRLAEKLTEYENSLNVVVLGLPRGGVVVAHEIARALRLPLDVFIVRKIGFPGESELAIGAVAETGIVVLNRSMPAFQSVSENYLQAEIGRQKEEIVRRAALYRRGNGMRGIEGKTVLLVDDGVATGATMKAAISALKRENIDRLVAALPVSPPDTAADLNAMADDFLCLETPVDFMAVGLYYRDFRQVTDQEVVDLLQHPAAEAA